MKSDGQVECRVSVEKAKRYDRTESHQDEYRAAGIVDVAVLAIPKADTLSANFAHARVVEESFDSSESTILSLPLVASERSTTLRPQHSASQNEPNRHAALSTLLASAWLVGTGDCPESGSPCQAGQDCQHGYVNHRQRAMNEPCCNTSTPANTPPAQDKRSPT